MITLLLADSLEPASLYNHNWDRTCINIQDKGSLNAHLRNEVVNECDLLFKNKNKMCVRCDPTHVPSIEHSYVKEKHGTHEIDFFLLFCSIRTGNATLRKSLTIQISPTSPCKLR